MIKVGITGGTGSGKSTVSRLLCEKYSLVLIDADNLSRAASEDKKVLAEISDKIGSRFIASDGTLDRKSLGKAVFSDESKRKKLNSIIHPVVRAGFIELCRKAEEKGEKLVIYDCPLLFEEGLEKDVDKTVLVYAHDPIRIERLKARDGLDEEQIKNRIAAQMSLDDKIPLSDIVFYNNGTSDDIISALPALYEELIK